MSGDQQFVLIAEHEVEARLADALRELGVSEATVSDIADGRTPTRPLVKLSLTRAAPLAPELWRTAYGRLAGQYAVFLERYDLAEDAQADEIIEAIEARALTAATARAERLGDMGRTMEHNAAQAEARAERLEAALRELVRAWDEANNPDPRQWRRLDRQIDAALTAARAALAASE